MNKILLFVFLSVFASTFLFGDYVFHRPTTDNIKNKSSVPGTVTEVLDNFNASIGTLGSDMFKHSGFVPATGNFNLNSFSLLEIDDIFLNGNLYSPNGMSFDINNNTRVFFPISNAIGFMYEGVEQMRIAQDENTIGVGIGILTPQEPLHVRVDFDGNKAIKMENLSNGNSAVARFIAKSDAGSTFFTSYGTNFITDGSKKASGAALITGNALAGGLSIVARQSSSDLRFYVGGNSDSEERMTIFSSGNIEFFDNLLLNMNVESISFHSENENAHHLRYTDVEAQALINTHGDNENRHHFKYLDSEAQSLIDTHAGNENAHDTRYTDAEAVSAVDVTPYINKDGSVMMEADLEMNDFSLLNLNGGSINFTGGLNKITKENFGADGSINANTLGGKEISTIESERTSEIITATDPFTPSYGLLFEHNPSGTELSLDNDNEYYPWVTSSVGLEKGVDYVVGNAGTDNLTIGTNGNGVYDIFIKADFEGSLSTVFHGALFVDGIEQEVTELHRKVGSSNDVASASGGGFVQLVNNNVLDVRFRAEGGLKTINLQHVILKIKRVEAE